MSKKIIIIGPAHPLRGGLATFDERLCREFIHQGDSCEIFSYSLQYPSFLFPGTTQFSTEKAPDDIKIYPIINSVHPFNWIHVGHLLNVMKPDIVLVRYWLPFMGPALGTILRQIKKNHHTTIVALTDNVLPHEKRIGDRIFTQYFLKPCDAFITMSDKVLNDLKQFEPNKPALSVSHPLYDNFGEIVTQTIARNKLDLPEEEKILLFFGFIRKYKGLDLLLNAMSILKKERHGNLGFKVMIAGEFYEDASIYDTLIDQLDLRNDLILRTNFITDSEVKYYLCASDGVIQPYRNATQSGVTPLAYHFEKPMIVTNVGSLADWVPHKEVGIVCEPTADSIATAIKEYFELGEAFFIPQLRIEKQKYSWGHITAAIHQLAHALTNPITPN